MIQNRLQDSGTSASTPSCRRRASYITSEYDSCVCSKVLENNSFIFLALYVDDSYNPKSMSNINVLKTQFIREFDMKDLGSAR